MKNWRIYKQLARLLTSRKLWVLVFACAAAYGLDIKPELQAVIFLVAGGAWAVLAAWEDTKNPPSG